MKRSVPLVEEAAEYEEGGYSAAAAMVAVLVAEISSSSARVLVGKVESNEAKFGVGGGECLRKRRSGRRSVEFVGVANSDPWKSGTGSMYLTRGIPIFAVQSRVDN